MMKILLIVLLALAALNFFLFIVSILQKGPSRWQGKTPREILGMDPNDASDKDIERLSKADIMQLFYASKPPDIAELQGEYKTRMLHAGIYGKTDDLYVNFLMGPGKWTGDAFLPLTEKSGHGYNLFRRKENGKEQLNRTLKMDTNIGRSVFDAKDSLHVVYRRHAKGLNKSMQDELRKINDELYLGLAYFSWAGGKINPFAFVVYGKPSPWKGLD